MIKLWLAKKLAPDIFKKAARLDRMRSKADDLYWWCGVEFPQISAVSRWLLDGDIDYNRDLNQSPISEYPSDIIHFREALRRGEYDK